MTADHDGIERFKIMERKLYRGIMTPSAVLAVFFGSWLFIGYEFRGLWLNLKLLL